MPEEKDNDLLDINFNVGSDEPNISTEDPGDGLLDINFDIATEEEKEEPKKAPATPIAEKTVEEPEVAQNQMLGKEEEQGRSFLSALPSQESGLDSQLSADNQLQAPVETPVGVPSPFRNVKEERLEMERQLAEAKAKQAEDPLAIKEGTEEHAELEATIAPKMNTEKDIEAFFNEIKSDQTIPEQHKEAAKIIAIAKKDELLERFEAGKREEKEKVFKGELENIQREAGDDVTQYIDREKTETVNSGYVSDEVVKEYKLNKRISDLTSKNAIETALISATIPHNAYVKLAAINKSENKAEELAAYKQDLLDQIQRDNKLLGNNISEEEFKNISERGVEYVSAVASSLAEISDKVNVVQGEKDEFLNEKHKGIDEEIASLRRKLIEKANSEEGLSDEDRDYMQGLIKKQENLKNSFFEKDGAKTADLITDDVKKGSNSYNLYREILKDIPKDLPSKEKFDLFYIAMKRISDRSLGEADMLDEDGNYDSKIENALRDFIGVENVLGVELPEAVGGLSAMEKEALEMKGKVDDLANIFLNNTAYSSENYWDELYGSLMGGLFPETAKASGLLSDTQSAGETIATLSDYGIDEGEGVNKETLEAFSDLVATPEGKLHLVGSTLGGSFAMMAKLMIGTSALKIGKAGKLGKALDKVEKYLDKSKYGKLINSSMKQGANAEFSGQLFDDQEELEFKQFAAGQFASDVVEKILGRAGSMKFASTLIKSLGMNQKAALDFTGKIFSRATGEFTEESMQTIVGAFNASDSLKGTIAELKKQFPDMDSVTEFAVLTGLMGATFGLQTSYNDVRKRLKDGGYNTDAADEIMEEIGKETKKAGEIINEGVKEEKGEGETQEEVTEEVPVEDTRTPEEVDTDAMLEVDADIYLAMGKGEVLTVGEGDDTVTYTDIRYNDSAKGPDYTVKVNGVDTDMTTKEFEGLQKDPTARAFLKREGAMKTEPVAEEEVVEEVTEPTADVEEEVAVEPVAEPEVIIDESGETEYTNKEGKFYSEEEVLNMTPEQVSEMTIKNPSEAVQAKVTPEAETGVTEEVVAETETAGETKEEVKTEKQLKAEAKQAKADAKLESEKKAEYRNNTLVDSVKEYNKKNDSQRKNKTGKALIAKARKMAADQGHTFEIKQDGSVSVTDSKGNAIKTSKKFKKGRSIPVTSTEDTTWSENTVKSGNLGDGTGFRMSYESDTDGDVQLTPKQVKDGFKQIEKGNVNSISAQRVLAALAKARKQGFFEVSQGTGGTTDYQSVPVDEVVTRELTEEEVLSKEEMDAEMEARAEEQTKAQKIQDATDSFVEAVRKMKTRRPGELKGGTGFDVLWDLAVEGIAKSIYAGGSTAAAVSEALAKFKASDWYKKKLPAEKKKIKSEAEADLIKRAEEISELAKIEKAKVEGTKKEAREAKKKERKQRKKSQEQKIKEEAKERLGNDKNASAKKVRQHLITLLDSPYLSKEVKDRIRKDPENMYDPQTNAWQSSEAVQMVEAFSEIDGGLEVLLEDVQENFLKYGAVGAFILDAITVKYIAEGRRNDAANVANAKIKVGTVIGQILQSFGKVLPKDLKESLMGTHISIAADIREDIRRQRDAKIKEKREKGKMASEEVVSEVKTELDESIGDISGHPDFDAAVKAGVAKYVKEQEAKAKAKAEQDAKKGSFAKRKAAERKKRKKIKEEYESRDKNIFFVTPVFTPAGMKYAGEIAASYVRTGMTTAAQVANALRQYFKKEHGVDISDSDIVKIFDEINLNDDIQENKDEVSKKLADKILNEISKKDGKKTGDAVEVLIRNLFAKAKESLPKRAKTDTNTSYREKMIRAMEGQEFAAETWLAAQYTIIDILNNAEATGKITGGEKGKILNDLEDYFGNNVGMPFSKKLLEQSLKEQIKSDGEKINDIVKEHYSNREEKGRSLAEKIVADTGLDPAKADELAAALEAQFAEMIKPYAERALAKVLGVENLSAEALADVMKVKGNQAALENIIKAINLGALTEESLVDAFSERFGFAKITDADVQKINAFIYDISLLPAKSVARDKAFIAFRTYMKGLTKNNQGMLERYYINVIGSYFYQHILGNTPTVLRSVYGLLWGGGLQLATEFIKNPRLFMNGLKTMFSNPTQSMSEHRDSFRVMGAILKGIKTHGVDIIKDAWSEGYIPYESALEGASEAQTTLGVLDQLSNADWKDISTKKKIAKLFETVPSKMLRMLMASDAVAHYAVRKGHIVTSVYNKVLNEGNYSSPTEKGFWEEVDRRAGNTDAVREMAEAQAAEELAKLQAAGVDTKNFRINQRVEEIIFESLEEDVKIQAEQKSMEMRLGHHPKGTFGLVYNAISPWINKVPGLMFVLPFLKIPLNLADAATDYVPLLGLKKAFFGRGNLMKALNWISPNLVSDKLIERTQSGKEFIAENRMDYLIKQGIGTAATGALLYAVASTFDLEDDDPEKRMEVVYKGTGDYADNKQLRDNKGLQQFHFRFKYPGTNTWSGWIDYRDSPLGMIFAFAGGVSDKLKYDRDYVAGDLQEGELLDAVATGAANSAFFFKEQNFLQAIGDMVGVIQNEKLAGSKMERFFADNTVRALKGITYPSVYTTTYNWKKAIMGEMKKKNVAVKDDFVDHVLSRLAQDVFYLDHMKEDYRDNLGQKVTTDNKIPFTPDKLIESFQDIFGISTEKDNVWNWLTANGKFSKSDIATDVIAGREMFFADKDGNATKVQVPTKVRDAFKLEHDIKVLERFNEEFTGSSENDKEHSRLIGEPEEYKKRLRKLRSQVKEDMMKNEWSHITFPE